MKTIKNKILFCLLITTGMLVNACKDAPLEDFKPLSAENIKVSVMDQTGAITKGSSTISIPLDVALSMSSGYAFEVELWDSQDTIQTLIDNGTLENTILLPPGTYQFPNVLSIPYGVKKTSFNVEVNINTIEKNYGKRLAFAVRLNSPSKGNTVDADKETFVVVLDTRDLLNIEDIRYVSFEGGTAEGRYMVPNGKNYSVSSAGIVIPIKLKLSGEAEGTSGFTVRLSLNQDTIGPMAGNLLPGNTIATNRGVFSLDTLVRFASNQTEATFNITFPLSTISSTVCCIHALSINIEDVTRNLVDPLKKNLIVLVTSADLEEKDITNEGTLSVSKESNDGPDSGEGSLKVVDGSIYTKFMINGFGGIWIQLRFDNPLIAKAYTITSGNDADDRDPRSWTLEGSPDGVNWQVLDSRTGETFNDRNQTKRYEFTNNGSYRYYRLNISENAGSSDFQMSEFRLIQLP